MLRTVARVEQRPWLLLGLVFAITCLFGFVLQAAGSAWLRLNADPIATHYRTTLSYTSALIAAATLIPLANVFFLSQLALCRRRPPAAEIAGAALGGAVTTAAAHL